jgi:hypothetical protein
MSYALKHGIWFAVGAIFRSLRIQDALTYYFTWNTIMNDLLQQLAALYEDMEKAYAQAARLLDFSCDSCPDNCCDSFFLHYTYIEWCYLREGFSALPQEKQAEYRQRARSYISKSEQALARGEEPAEMCPINEKGRCSLYKHRLLICRLHGIPASMTSPNGQSKNFPGCFRCQELTVGQTSLPTMDRTKFFRTMVQLEQSLLAGQAQKLPRVKMTLAEMLVTAPPLDLSGS